MGNRDKLTAILFNLNVRGKEYKEVVQVLEQYAIWVDNKKQFNITHLTSNQVDELLHYFESKAYISPVSTSAPRINLNVYDRAIRKLENSATKVVLEEAAKIIDEIVTQKAECGCFQHKEKDSWVTVKYCDAHWKAKHDVEPVMWNK